MSDIYNIIACHHSLINMLWDTGPRHPLYSHVREAAPRAVSNEVPDHSGM